MKTLITALALSAACLAPSAAVAAPKTITIPLHWVELPRDPGEVAHQSASFKAGMVDFQRWNTHQDGSGVMIESLTVWVGKTKCSAGHKADGSYIMVVCSGDDAATHYQLTLSDETLELEFHYDDQPVVVLPAKTAKPNG